MRKHNNKEKKGVRRDTYAIGGILAGLCLLLFRIPLVALIGEKGIGYFSLANELYLVTGCLLAYGLSEASASLIRYRLRREQYANASRVLRTAMITGFAAGGSASVLLFFGSRLLAEKAAGTPLFGLSISVAALGILFQTLTGVLKGYFQGSGSRVPALHSRVLEVFFMIAGGLLGTLAFQGYGRKVAALLQNSDYEAAYGAMGAAVGILSSSVLCLLHMLILFFIYKKGRKDAGRESIRSQEKSIHVVHMLIGTAVPFSLSAALYQGLTFLDGLLFNGLVQSEASVSVWGSYYGKYAVIVGLAGGCMGLLYVEKVRRVVFLADRSEHREAVQKLGYLIHQIAVWGIGTSVFVAVLSENILDLLFRGDNGQTASLLAWGGIVIFLSVFSGFFSAVLVRSRKLKYVICYELLGFVLHTAAVILLLQTTGLGILSVVLGTAVFYGLCAVLGFLLVCRQFQYRQEWVRSFAFTAAAGGASGLLMMLLNKAISPFTGTQLALLILLPIGILAYMLLLIVSRSVKEEELSETPLGVLMLRMGQKLHVM